MKFELYDLLIKLAQETKMHEHNVFTTAELAKEYNTSAQTISRKLRELEASGIISKRLVPKGMEITLSQKGRDAIQSLSSSLQKIIKNAEPMLKGTLETGMGEGRYYMGIKGYQEQFKEKLGYVPYAGTLNMKCKEEEIASFIKLINPIEIIGFSTKERTYGGLLAYKVQVEDIQAAIIKPVRTRHGNSILEIIAPAHLRTTLKIKDGDMVVLSL